MSARPLPRIVKAGFAHGLSCSGKAGEISLVRRFVRAFLPAQVGMGTAKTMETGNTAKLQQGRG
jgi:hypothetical protein